MGLTDLPWVAIHQLVIRSRRLHFAVEKPDVRGIWVPKRQDPAVTLADIRIGLAEVRFEDGRIPSFHYHGEDLNLRRPAGLRSIDGVDDPVWMQTHVRWFEHPGYYEGLVHTEPSPLAQPRLHLDEVGFDWDQGIHDLEPAIADLFEYELSKGTPTNTSRSEG